MSKTIDIICFIGWSMSLAFGILAACGLMTIGPGDYICAVLICLFHHGERLFMRRVDNETVAYLCDEKACDSCQQGDDRYCYYTLDIKHAANFEEIAPGKFMEKE